MYYQVFDNLDLPKVVSCGSFDITSANKPDFVQFIKWSNVNDQNWNIQTDKNSSIGDSSVTSVWSEKPLVPGESRVYKCIMGLDSSLLTHQMQLFKQEMLHLQLQFCLHYCQQQD